MGKVNSKSIHHSLKPKSFKIKNKHRQQTHSFSSTSSTSSSNDFSSSSQDLSLNDDLFVYVDNRKFCKWGDYLNYVYPVDHDETDRSQMQHYMYKHVWDGNFSSPIEQK